jgi:hypothetical protein
VTDIPRPETTHRIAIRTVDPNDSYTPGPEAQKRISAALLKQSSLVWKLLVVLVPTLVALGGWIYRQEQLARTVETHGVAIEQLKHGVEQTGWNQWSMCKALRIEGCERPK